MYKYIIMKINHIIENTEQQYEWSVLHHYDRKKEYKSVGPFQSKEQAYDWIDKNQYKRHPTNPAWGELVIDRIVKTPKKLQENEENTEQQFRWLIKINDKPAAHYPSESEALNIKNQLKRKLGPAVNIEIEKIPAKKYKIAETLNPGNELPSLPTEQTHMIYKYASNSWKPLVRFPTRQEAEEYCTELESKTSGKYKIKSITYPKTQYE
jgi:hypothetical protein